MVATLKEAREVAGYTVEYVASRLNIRKHYLLALEEGDFDALPGKIYVDGYTKIYYEFLGVDLPVEQNVVSKIEQVVPDGDNFEIESKYKKYIIFCSVILLVLVVVSYNLLKIQNQDSYIIEQNSLNDRNNKEIVDRYYQTD